MNPQELRRNAVALCALSVLVIVAGCKSAPKTPPPPDVNAPKVQARTVGPIAMPTGVDYSGVTVTITAVPEASTSMVGFAALGMIATGIYRARKSVKQTA